MKQTAVEWLVEQLQAPCRGIPSHILEEAKQMEKEQMKESFAEGFKSGITDYMDIQNGYDGKAIGFTQYYNENYGK